MGRRLAVLAGGGPLPGQVIAAARQAGREVFVLAFEGETDPALVRNLPHAWVPLGAIGQALRTLHAAGAEDVVMIGPVRRPALSQLKLDLRGMQLLAKLGLQGHGDDRIFKAIVAELEGEGFHVVGADDFLDALLASTGAMTAKAPDSQAEQDIALGVEVAMRLGELDIGQAVVVQHGLVLGVEAVEGTDRLLARCGQLRREGGGGVLIKLKKPKQERRADLPVIGPETVTAAAEARFDGIAIHAGKCLMIERRELIERADRSGLFVVGVGGPG